MCKYFLIAAALFACVILPTLKRDDTTYAALVKSSEPKEMRTYCQQFRDGVTKRVWGEQCCQIESNHSELFFFSSHGDVELIEELDALTCIVQEECFFKKGKPYQVVRLLEAKEASFNYNTQVLTAADVQMWSYELPGHKPPSSIDADPLMEGQAKTIELQLKGKRIDVLAHGFEGKML